MAGASKLDVVQARLRTQPGLQVLGSALRGNVLWIAWDTGVHHGLLIECNLLGKSRGYGWGYQSWTEQESPKFYSCPLDFLALVPTTDSRALAWRAKVVEYHAKGERVRALQVGQTVQLAGECEPHEARIVSLRPLMGEANGRRFRLPKRLLRV
jgi:hypothetical protein